ncbi:Inner membrane protein translocase component YidC, long form [Sandaracinus amylolyticus]|uniref:Membrane protein insertase YidC n=2 Tax=Sandaracinus amylolyticus TaxID=927083 RepID=A0A0F6YLJ6_9BACT|nr:Inner membrane protein translocase component YidC, long form [Sandaracinus amylolyticus]
MQGENQRSLPTMLLVAGAFLAIYYGAQYFFGSPEETTPDGGETAELTPEQREQRDAEVRRDSAARQGQLATGTITTGDMIATIDNLGGGLTHVQLTAERYRQAEAAMDLVTTDREEYRPLRIDLPGVSIPVDAVWDLEQVSPTEVRLTWQGRGVEVVRSFRAGEGPYQIWQTVRVRNTGSTERDLRLRVSTWHYVAREAEGGSSFFGNRSPAISQGLCRHDDETERKDREALLERHGWGGAIDFVAVENTYFVQAIAPHETPAEFCGLQATNRGDVDGEPHGSLFEATLLFPRVELDAGEQHVWQTLAFVGPKTPAALEAAGHDLPEVVNLGTFAMIARAFASLLRFIQTYVGNWGIAIIILTIMVRIALFPLTDRSFRSMAQMRKLKPEMDEINARFPSDPEKKQAAIMELYRKHGINPLAQLGGCLPVLFQMPVFFALYASLSTNIELYHQPFALWWQDLSAPDPFFVLPLALGALMWLQQKLTPTSMDPAQARVMQFMPVIVTLFMLFLPAGLCLYMLTNSVLGIGQQKLNEWRLNRSQAAAVATTGTTTESGANEGDKGTGGASASKRGPGRSRRG